MMMIQCYGLWNILVYSIPLSLLMTRYCSPEIRGEGTETGEGKKRKAEGNGERKEGEAEGTGCVQ
jgi:hypothetical protein